MLWNKNFYIKLRMEKKGKNQINFYLSIRLPFYFSCFIMSLLILKFDLFILNKEGFYLTVFSIFSFNVMYISLFYFTVKKL